MSCFAVAAGWEGKTLAVAVSVAAVGLAVWQGLERRRRPKGLARRGALLQRSRRTALDHRGGVGGRGGRISRGAVFDRQADRAAKAAWAYNWFAVGLLLIALLLLAFYDWWVISRYARRQRQAIIDAGRAELEAIRERQRNRATALTNATDQRDLKK